MKKLLVSIIAMSLCVLMSAAVCAAGQPVSVTVDGVADSDCTPVWNDAGNRVLVTPQFFAEHFGTHIAASAGVTTVSKNGHTISFKEGEKQFMMDGIGGRALDSENSSAYIPLRFMCEALGASVGWNAETGAVTVTTNAIKMPETASPYMKGVTVFDQATIRLEGEKVIYIDPYRIAGEPHDADVILVTHTHGDHFDIESIRKLAKDNTQIFISNDGVEKAKENGFANVTGVAPDNGYTADGLVFNTVPAYNKNHPKENGFVGYIVTVNGVAYYAAGDTDYIPEMDAIDADVAFLPIDGRYNMDEAEAARAANAIKPKVAVPYHYNNFSSEESAQSFVSQLDDGISGAIMTFKMYEK